MQPPPQAGTGAPGDRTPRRAVQSGRQGARRSRASRRGSAWQRARAGIPPTFPQPGQTGA
eukprot:7353553-Alexandrium_andersonii.AAC.1